MKKVTCMNVILFLWYLCSSYALVLPYDFQELDFMSHFFYPIDCMQSIRCDLAQALYALQTQQPDYDTVVSTYLHDVQAKLPDRHSIQHDDSACMQAMLAQIYDHIESLGIDSNNSLLHLCQQFQACI